MASRASNWNHEELRKLVELWADVSIQAIMDSKQKNTGAYDKIKVRLAAAGFIRTVAQINAKIKHLRRLYHKAKDAVQRSGVSADTSEGQTLRAHRISLLGAGLSSCQYHVTENHVTMHVTNNGS